MGNTNKNKSKKCRRKIRIRLVDPNIPDSYVCEIFDSSLENEEDISKNNEPLSEDNKGPLKPKNYFELLMTKKCKKNKINTSNDNEELIIIDDEKSIPKRKQLNQKIKSVLTQSVDEKRDERKCKNHSSQGENLLQIESKLKFKNLDLKEESSCVIDVTEENVNEARIKKNDIFTLFDSPKVETPNKTFSILSYFSVENGPKGEIDSEKLEEITSVRNSLKICQTRNTSKPNQKQILGETCQNEKKNSLNDINKENVKLAPLFYKKENIVIDSVRQKARLEFLYKGSPSSVIKRSDSKTNENILNFPTVHVQQRNDSIFWSQREICLPLPELHRSEESAFSITKKFRLQIKRLNVVNNSVLNKTKKLNKEFLDKIKCKYVELNLDLIIDGLKEKRDIFLARTKDIEKSKTASNTETSNNETVFEELNALWTEKYKPKSKEILGNGSVVKKLKKWLESWKSFDEELKVLAKCSRSLKNQQESDDESGDDFLDSESKNFELKTPNNVCIISGPNGCGKTALVYALANELEFSVLELNASSKRTGKKVLSDLQEATQSHKVQRLNFILTDGIQKEVKKKRKKKKKFQEEFKNVDQINDCKISLILIEDADIVFDEHDEGFFPAIASLVQTSKRPLIFLTNQPNCHHLYNIKAEQCLILEMELPNFYKSCALLDIVSALEGTFFDKELLEFLLRQNHFDLRKSLLQLQFWVNSNKNTVALQKQFDLGLLWWGLSKFLFAKDIKHFEKLKSRKRKKHNDLFDSSDDDLEMTSKKIKLDSNVSQQCSTLNVNAMPRKSNPSIESYFKILDLASVLDGFCLSGSQEPVPGFEYKPRDGLSLDENMEEVSWIREDLSEQLSKELVTLSAQIFAGQFEKENEIRKLNFVSPCWEEIRWRISQEKAREELSVLVSLQRGRDNRSLHLDYLPILRNICRMEKNRSEKNPKRKNRFYHYLNNLGLELNDENLEINCDVFDR